MKDIKPDHKQIADYAITGMPYEIIFKKVYPEKVCEKKAMIQKICKVLRRQDVHEYYEKQKASYEKRKTEKIIDEGIWTFKDTVNAYVFVIKTAQKDAIEISKRNMTSDKYERVMPTATANSIIGANRELSLLLGFINPDRDNEKTAINLSNMFIAATDFRGDPDSCLADPPMSTPNHKAPTNKQNGE